MKKIYSLLFIFLFAVAAVAQNVVLVDTEGKEYANGATLTLFAEDEEEGGEVVWTECPSPVMYNKGSEDINSVVVVFTVKSMPQGTSFMYCWGGDCQIISQAGNPTTSLSGSLKAGEKLPSLIEWTPVNEDFEFIEGVCTVDWTIYENGKAQNHYTVRYVRGDDPEGIRAVTTDNGQRTAGRVYDLQGRGVNAAVRGLYIQNGSKVLR